MEIKKLTKAVNDKWKGSWICTAHVHNSSCPPFFQPHLHVFYTTLEMKAKCQDALELTKSDVGTHATVGLWIMDRFLIPVRQTKKQSTKGVSAGC